MPEKFFVGNIIASGQNPLEKGFICGSVISVCHDGYWVWTLGMGSAKIFLNMAISLDEVVAKHPDALIVADKNLWEEKKLFVGGFVSRDDKFGERYMIELDKGVGYIPHANAVTFKDIAKDAHLKHAA